MFYYVGSVLQLQNHQLTRFLTLAREDPDDFFCIFNWHNKSLFIDNS
ncbi:hypothetical protein HBNCFIEN_00858 [Legionella sp. PC997]|nr:hypothetical protein HBNCFIEN_00858 [Legionella sp. PC997]